MVRTAPTAEASLADMRARRRFGIAIEAMMRMIATTISNSISEKPFCFLLRSIMFVLDSAGGEKLRACGVNCPAVAAFGRNQSTPITLKERGIFVSLQIFI